MFAVDSIEDWWTGSGMDRWMMLDDFLASIFFKNRCMLRHIIALSFTIAFSFILSHSQQEEMLMDVSSIPVFLSSGCSWSIGRRSYLVTLKSQHPQFGSVQLLGIQRYGWRFRNAAHQLIWRISMNIPLFPGLYTFQVVNAGFLKSTVSPWIIMGLRSCQSVSIWYSWHWRNLGLRRWLAKNSVQLAWH